MSIVTTIQDLCNKNNITFYNLEQTLGFGNGTIRRWNDNIPKTDRLIKVANYFNVSVDYLLDRGKTQNKPSFSHNKNSMPLFDLIKNLSLEKGISIARLEKELGLANGSIKKWSKVIPSGDRLAKVANYFNVSVDYLLGRESNCNFYDFAFSVNDSHLLTEEDKEKLTKTFKDITNLYLNAKNTR